MQDNDVRPGYVFRIIGPLCPISGDAYQFTERSAYIVLTMYGTLDRSGYNKKICTNESYTQIIWYLSDHVWLRHLNDLYSRTAYKYVSYV